MGEDTDLTPTLDDLVADSVELSPVWGAWCPDEESQVAQDLAAESDGTTAAEEHNLATGHTAVGTLSLPNALAVNTDIQLFPFPFCFRYNGRPWQSMTLLAPGADEAATTAGQLVNLLNLAATGKGFPALFSATSGICSAF
ncbi:hypothetical protein ACKI1I_28855 [Streptomyces turgidiscabies]|uniref:Uncharacterized protein n=1 Tax=Streptomyces turgidiscabies (strain Car8) TaxID=698760 RepID=L7ETW2_STRT8|nr:MULTISPECIES: hypothetical protein [Streptomyces]ELP62121.1 hypothetical protein STRTUCAR8_00208 [Streptomyces turgidiscabies Car8]MDX3498140.1 hypothetical protein [Streptomyces turgidiscabies]GAQ75113.1 hypothetical protein T45_06894 [Streptomyces turgidiscabies]